MFEKLKDMLWASNPRNRVWPRSHGDPSVKGPRPRILSHEAALELRRHQREMQGDDAASDVHKKED